MGGGSDDEFMLREGHCARNPARDVRAPKSKKRLPATLDADQMARLLEFRVCDSLSARDKAIMELFYSSGLRLSELVGLDIGPHLLEQLHTHWAERRKHVTTRTPPPLQHTRGVLGRGCQPSGTPHEVVRCASLTAGRRNGDDSEAALGAAHHRLHTSPEHRRALA